MRRMNPILAILLCAAGGYVSGATPFGYLAGKLKGIDIRQHGSGNIGATNAIRVLGKGIGIPVFILDLFKGWLPVWLAKAWLVTLPGAETLLSTAAVVTGLAAVLGHMFTFWLNYKGGKGVATATGVLLGIAPIAMLGGLGVWLLFFFTTRYVSLASMMAGVGVALTMMVQMSRVGSWDWVMLGFGLLIMILVIVRHTANIRRILSGTEPKAGSKKQPT
jgi:glycerol-3-phosphate acyltransferase PlsY